MTSLQGRESSPLSQHHAADIHKLSECYLHCFNETDQHIREVSHHRNDLASMFLWSKLKLNLCHFDSKFVFLLLFCIHLYQYRNKLQWKETIDLLALFLISVSTSRDCLDREILPIFAPVFIFLYNHSSLKEIFCQFHCIYASKIDHP